jgi:hypothetical protein
MTLKKRGKKGRLQYEPSQTNQRANGKDRKVADVLEELAAHCETCDGLALKKQSKNVSDNDKECPVEACKRYIENRLDYLDYQSAINAGLPIGTGEVESGHGWLIQERLKLSGAWWLEKNINKMLALRTNRANDEWQSYWLRRRQAAA